MCNADKITCNADKNNKVPDWQKIKTNINVYFVLQIGIYPDP